MYYVITLFVGVRGRLSVCRESMRKRISPHWGSQEVTSDLKLGMEVRVNQTKTK